MTSPTTLTDDDSRLLEFVGRFGLATVDQVAGHLGRDASSIRARVKKSLVPNGYVAVEERVRPARRTRDRVDVLSITPLAARELELRTGVPRDRWIVGFGSFRELRHSLLQNDAFLHIAARLEAKNISITSVKTHRELISPLMSAVKTGKRTRGGRGQIVDFVICSVGKKGKTYEIPVEVAFEYKRAEIEAKHSYSPNTIWVTPSAAQAKLIKAVVGRDPILLRPRRPRPEVPSPRRRRSPATTNVDPSERHVAMLAFAVSLGGKLTAAHGASLEGLSRMSAGKIVAGRLLRELTQGGYLRSESLRGSGAGRPTMVYQLTEKGARLVGAKPFGKPAREPHELEARLALERASIVIALRRAGWYATVDVDAQEHWLRSRSCYFADELNREAREEHHRRSLSAISNGQSGGPPPIATHELRTAEDFLSALPGARLKDGAGVATRWRPIVPGILGCEGVDHALASEPPPSRTPILIIVDDEKLPAAVVLKRIKAYEGFRVCGLCQIWVALTRGERQLAWQEAITAALDVDTSKQPEGIPDRVIFVGRDHRVTTVETEESRGAAYKRNLAIKNVARWTAAAG